MILSGTLHDGTAGAAAVKRHGGAVLVQDPHEAMAAGMPRSAIEHVDVDQVGPVAELAAAVTRLSKELATAAEGQGGER